MAEAEIAEERRWVVIARWPQDRRNLIISYRQAHYWTHLAVACLVEDYGRTRPAPEHTPRCAICVRWLIGHL